MGWEKKLKKSHQLTIESNDSVNKSKRKANTNRKQKQNYIVQNLHNMHIQTQTHKDYKNEKKNKKQTHNNNHNNKCIINSLGNDWQNKFANSINIYIYV